MARLLDSAWPYFTLAAVLLLVALASQFEVRLPRRDTLPIAALPEVRESTDLNVVFLLIDTLRADRLGIYGYERPTSRVIDDAARHGVVFENVLSQSTWTKTSMASLWTATYPVRNGVLRYDHVLPDEAVTPAELFQEAGYRTYGIWRNGWVEPNFGFGQGFDVYLKPVPGAERARLHRQSPGASPLSGTDEDLTVSAVDFIAQNAHQKFLLYLHYMDVHQYVYDDAASIFGTSYSDAYDQSIHWTDRQIGRLFDALHEADILKRTLIVIASDHGEAFLEHGVEGHARDLYREVSQVPLIFILPFVLEQGIRVEPLVANVDVWPTILDIVGLPPLPGADGRSLLPLVYQAAGVAPPEGDGDGLVRPVFSQLQRGWGRPTPAATALVSVAHEGRRLITELKPDPEAPRKSELYDFEADRLEQNDLLTDGAAEDGELFRLIDEYAARKDDAPWGVAPKSVELDEMRLNHLRALGYVVGQ